MIRTLVTIGLVVIGLSGWPGVATAGGLPAATGFVDCVLTDGSAYVYDGTLCDTGGTRSTRSLGPVAGLMASTAYPGNFASYDTGGSGFLTYYFMISGPITGNLIPVDVDYRLHASHTGSDGAFAEIIATAGSDIYTPPSSDSRVICTDPVCSDNSVEVAGTLHLMTRVGLIGSIFLEDEVTGTFSPDAASALVFADPFIHVDRSFPGYAAYSVELSDGVANALPGTVPEPASWIIMIAGFGTIGATARRKRQAAQSCSEVYSLN